MVSQIARNEGGSKVWASDKCAVNEAAVLAAAGPEHTPLAKRVMGMVKECMKPAKHAATRPEMLMVAKWLGEVHRTTVGR